MFCDRVLMFVLSTIKEYKMKKFAVALALLVMGIVISPKANTQQVLLVQAQPTTKPDFKKFDLQSMPEIRSTSTRGDSQVDALLEEAFSLMQDGNFSKAVKVLNKAIRIDSNNGYAYYLRAIARANLNDENGAIADLRKAAKIAEETQDEQLAQLIQALIN
jgi:tetratricopeptide (TPR) repeat protein